MKTEPDVFSIDTLKTKKVTHWEGVRNYQARNYMRDSMRKGDKVLFYHSNTDPIGIAGLAEIIKEGYPDHFSWDPKSNYFDPKSTPESPRWHMVDVGFVKKFKQVISLAELKTYPELDGMVVTQTGSRLSVQPVEKRHYEFIVALSERSTKQSKS